MEKIMAVITKEKEYAERFCEYVNKKSNLIFTAVPFENMEKCDDFSLNHNVRLILADRDIASDGRFYERGKSGIMAQGAKTLLLSDGQTEEGIKKYQSAEEIVRNIMDSCEDIEFRKSASRIGRTAKIIGVYTPTAGMGKTAFALTLAKMHSRSKKVLYMNIDEFSGLERITGIRYQKSLSDAVYHMKQGKLSFQKLHSMIYSYSGIDHIPPMKYVSDMNALCGEDYSELITEILKQSDYAEIVVEMGSFANAASDVMNECDVVYMPLRDDQLSRMKLEEYEDFIRESKREALIDKTVKVILPEDLPFKSSESYVDSLLFGAMGDLIRQL